MARILRSEGQVIQHELVIHLHSNYVSEKVGLRPQQDQVRPCLSLF